MSHPGPVASCPQCGSQSLQAIAIPRKSLGAGVLAEVALGTAAGLAASADTVVQNVCLNCGCQWFAGTRKEARIRALSGQLGEAKRREAEIASVVETKEHNRIETRETIMLSLGCLVLLAVLTMLASCAAYLKQS
jgi:hypothetical protein